MPGFTLTVVERVFLGLVAGLEGPRCLRWARMSSRLARMGTAVFTVCPSIPAELLRIMKVVIFGLLERAPTSAPGVVESRIRDCVSGLVPVFIKVALMALPLAVLE